LKVFKFQTILLILLISSGCTVHRVVVKESRSKVMGAYLDAAADGRADSANYIKENLKMNQAFGYVKPYVPIVVPADVRLVWIPTHKSKDDSSALVSGHWVYIMVKQSSWFIDAQESDKVKIPVVIPYKEGTKK